MSDALHPLARAFPGTHTAQIIRLRDRAALPSGPDPAVTLIRPLKPGSAFNNLLALRGKVEAAAQLLGNVDPTRKDALAALQPGHPTAKIDAVLCQLWADINGMAQWPDMRQPDRRGRHKVNSRTKA